MTIYGVSIIICCHNGGRRLPDTIRHIACQEVPSHIPWEFILVDNGSTDGSAEIATHEWAKYNCDADFCVVNESKLGLSHARAKGFKEARYDFVIMCDDDNWLAPDYVNITYRAMRARPNIGALGGCGQLVFEIDPPGYIERSNIFAAGPQARVPGKVKQNKVYGAGCVIRKSAYEELTDIGYKSLLTDRKGNELSSGGDYELCYALAILGYDIWYDDRLRFMHFITRERLTWEYFMRYAIDSSRCFDVLSSYKFIAENSLINETSAAFIGRNFFWFLRRFIRVNVLRAFEPADSDAAKVLYFRHTTTKYKLTCYFRKFREMIDLHNQIRSFKATCVAASMARSVKKEVVYPVPMRLTLSQTHQDH